MHYFALPSNAKYIFMLVIENFRRVEVLSFAEESEHRNRTFEIMAIKESLCVLIQSVDKNLNIIISYKR